MDPADSVGSPDSNPAPEERGESLEPATRAASSWHFEVDNEANDDDENDPDWQDEPDEDDEEDDEFHDAHDGAIEFDVVFGGDDDDEEDEEENDEDNEDDEEEDDDHREAVISNGNIQIRGSQRLLNLLRAGPRAGGLLTRAQILAFLGDQDLINILDDAEDDDDGPFFGHWNRRRRREPKDPNRFPKVPSESGIELMRTGEFGSNEYNLKPRKHIARRMLERELGLGNREDRRRNNDLIVQNLVPRTRAEHIIHYDDPIYSGQFSDDGNFFYACCQDFRVRMYDTSNPYNWKHYKTVSYPWGQWTLTDASLSPDNKWLAYTSISSIVSIAPTDPNDRGDPYSLDLDPGEEGEAGWGRGGRHYFGIYSIRFSGDGRELVAGTNANSIVVYDIERRTVVHHIQGHENHVNAVCFADKNSPHIVYSGSDDTTIKVWDRRSMGDRREAGAFVGHIEGLTYIDSKGDGRYLLSNGKDQSMKLWDIRMAMSTDRFRELDPMQHTRNSDFDYRQSFYDEEEWDKHPNDNSVVTFRGHKVLRTLIRCHFSPPSSTNSRYVYSGSTDGTVHIYNMDATKARVIDVKKATQGTRRVDRRSRFYRFDEPGSWATCVRDASWHPTAPVLAASAWNGYNMARGTVTLHSFNDAIEDEGDEPLGRSLDEMAMPDAQYRQANYTAMPW